MAGINSGILHNAYPLSTERIKELEKQVLENNQTFAYIDENSELCFSMPLGVDDIKDLAWSSAYELSADEAGFTKKAYKKTGLNTFSLDKVLQKQNINEQWNDLSVDPATGEIFDSWDSIIASVNDNTYATKYAVGNYKPLDLGSEGVINMQIAAIDSDVLSDGSGNAHITWIAKELLATPHGMASNDAPAGDWATSEMRVYLNNDIWMLIPENIKNAIVAVDKSYTYSTRSNSEITTLTCSDRLWIPSNREVNLNDDREQFGASYADIFVTDTDRIKQADGVASGWWLRSGRVRSNSYDVVSPSGTRAVPRQGSVQLLYIALGFCI